MTGWFNIVGLIGIVASVGYGAAIFLNALLGALRRRHLRHQLRRHASTSSARPFLLFLLILRALHGGEHLRRPLPGADQQHLGRLAPARRRGDHRAARLRARRPPERRASSSASGSTTPGFDGGSTGNFGFWFLVLPIGFLLTMYTQTGYDASAHTAEETRGAAIAAAQGVWRSVFFSALIGWFVLLALPVRGERRGRDQRRRPASSSPIFTTRARLLGGEARVLIIATVGQLFCGAAGLTSASRTWYAFSRDRGDARAGRCSGA